MAIDGWRAARTSISYTDNKAGAVSFPVSESQVLQAPCALLPRHTPQLFGPQPAFDISQAALRIADDFLVASWKVVLL